MDFEIELNSPQSLELELGISSIKPRLENLDVRATAETQIFNHPDSYGYDVVTVEPISIKLKDITINENGEYENEDKDYDGLGKITVAVDDAPVEELYQFNEEVWS